MPGTAGHALSSVVNLHRIVRHVERRGADGPDFLRSLDLDPGAVAQPATLVRMADVLAAYDAAALATGDPLVGLAIARESSVADYGVAGFLMANQPRLLDGWRDIARVLGSLVPGYAPRTEVVDDVVRLWMCPDEPVPGFGHLATDVLAAHLLRARELCGAHILAREVAFDLPHAAGCAEALARLSAVFGVAPCLRDVVGYAFSVDLADAHRAVPGADATLLVHLHEAIETQIARRRAAEGTPEDVLRFPNCVVDLKRGEVHREDQRHHLTTKERQILRFLASRRNAVVPHDALEQEVWGMGKDVLSHAPAVAIRRLRMKIESDPSQPTNLVTVFGEGWKLNLGD